MSNDTRDVSLPLLLYVILGFITGSLISIGWHLSDIAAALEKAQ